jgi:two-component system, OmpR family, phosphate regulon response regulator PhoB
MHSIESTAQILIVDRDVAIVEPLRLGLAGAGFVVRAITDKVAAMAAIVERPPQLVIVDWNMPNHGGLELIQVVRDANPRDGIGLIILSALSAEHDVVDGLNVGADDYIAKPFSSGEVVARVRAVLRTRLRNQRQRSLSCGDLVLNATTNTAVAHCRALDLSPVEFRLLEFFMRHPGRVFGRTQLLAEVWGAESDIDERTVDVNVQRLRKLLTEPGCAEYIQTVRGFGYRLAAPRERGD